MKGFNTNSGFSTLPKGFQLLSKGFQFPGKGFQYPDIGGGDVFFARYFNALPTYVQLAHEQYIRDTVSSHDQTRTNSATQVVDSDNAGECWIDAASEFSFTPHFTGVIDGKVGVGLTATYETNQTINGTAARDGYRITHESGRNISNVKIWDAAWLEANGKLGAELVTNGTFDTDSDWNKGTGVTISGGKAVFTAVGSGFSLSQNSVFSIGLSYLVVYSVEDYSSAIVRARCGSGTDGALISENGTFSQSLICSGSTTLFFTASGGTTTLKIDNASAKQIQLTQADMTSVEANQAGVAAQYLYDEKEGIITFNRLINNSYAIGHGELVNATLPAARVELYDRDNVASVYTI